MVKLIKIIDVSRGSQADSCIFLGLCGFIVRVKWVVNRMLKEVINFKINFQKTDVLSERREMSSWGGSFKPGSRKAGF